MWYSYHIYTQDRALFLDNLNYLQNRFQYSEFFFIQYLDPIGFHFRLRVRCSEIECVEREIKSLFRNSRVLKKIYDPEYNVFMEALSIYEEFSVKLTKFLVENREIAPHHYINDVIKQLLCYFRCNHSQFIYNYSTYWDGYVRFQTKEKKRILFEQLRETLEIPAFTNVMLSLNSLEEHHLNKELCFKFLHMTLNKCGFSIPDEVDILLEYSKNKLN